MEHSDYKVVLRPEIIEMPNTRASITTVHHVICTMITEYYRNRYTAPLLSARAYTTFPQPLPQIITTTTTENLDHHISSGMITTAIITTVITPISRAIRGSEEEQQEMIHGTIH